MHGSASEPLHVPTVTLLHPGAGELQTGIERIEIMNPKARTLLKWRHIAFGIVALCSAFVYLRDVSGDRGTDADKIKGGVRILPAMFMVLP